MQVWPELYIIENSVAATAASISASSKTIAGPLPPNSNTTFFKFDFAEAIWIARPVFVLPVKEITLILICIDIAFPDIWPWPDRTLITPGGKPHSSIHWATFHDVRGAFSDDFRTTVFPAATAGAIFFEKNTRGAFHGIIMPTTPNGCRRDIFRKPGVFKLVCPWAYPASPK